MEKSPQWWREYRAQRASGATCRTAYNIADYNERMAAEREQINDDGCGGAAWTEGPFTLRAKVMPDDYGDLSFIGELSNTPRHDSAHAGTIDRARTMYGEQWKEHVPMHGEYRYINLERSYDSYVAEFRAAKMGKALADELARRAVEHDVARMELSANEGDTRLMAVEVVASVDGIALGADNLGGIDVGTGNPYHDPYITETILECAQEALDAARAKLASLRALTITSDAE